MVLLEKLVHLRIELSCHPILCIYALRLLVRVKLCLVRFVHETYTCQADTNRDTNLGPTPDFLKMGCGPAIARKQGLAESDTGELTHFWLKVGGMSPFSFSDEFSIEFSPFLVIFFRCDSIS